MNRKKFLQILILVMFGAGAAGVMGALTAGLVCTLNIGLVPYSLSASDLQVDAQTRNEMSAGDKAMSPEERATLKLNLTKWNSYYGTKLRLLNVIYYSLLLLSALLSACAALLAGSALLKDRAYKQRLIAVLASVSVLSVLFILVGGFHSRLLTYEVKKKALDRLAIEFSDPNIGGNYVRRRLLQLAEN
jgi:hypothetical protein